MDPEVESLEVVAPSEAGDASFAKHYARQVLTEARAVEEFNALAVTLKRLGFKRLLILGFEAPWEWNLHPAIRVAALIEPRGFDARFDAVEFLEEHFGREIHITDLRLRDPQGEPEPVGVEIDGLD
jgi:hypothetical protein